MIRRILDLLRPDNRPRPKRFFDKGPDHLYAIGDVHGCDDLLARLEAMIVEDCQRRPGTKWLVMLGDYVDRGPKSSAVLTRLAGPPPAGLIRFCLAGNHEEVMLDFLRNPGVDHLWLQFGGLQTLYSYGIRRLPGDRQAWNNVLEHFIPPEHIAFMDGLPSLISVPGYCFVHGGIEEGVPLEEQEDRTLLWLRPEAGRTSIAKPGFITIHGHTPVPRVEVGAGRINLDTGAFMTGRLSAIRISREGGMAILQ
jgi:serine/threonine protein phosphatase 1